MIESKHYRQLIEMALLEDIGSGDITTGAIVAKDCRGQATIYSRSEGIICGVNIAAEVFKRINTTLTVKLFTSDGEKIRNQQKIMEIEGCVANILSAERTALNFMSRLSGIATETEIYCRQLEGTGAGIYDTRKTLPGWRMLEKHAVVTGGGNNHRIGLWDAVLIKENHIKVAGSIGKAVKAAKEYTGGAKFIQVEVEKLSQLEEAILASPDMILLDNLCIEDIFCAVGIIKSSGKRILSEVSGNINLSNLRQVALTGVDRISSGAITHSVKNFDFTLLIE